MEMCLNEAARAFEEEEVPVGALIVRKTKRSSQGRTTSRSGATRRSPTRSFSQSRKRQRRWEIIA